MTDIDQRLEPEPLALTPPITIGSLTNVPAPGAQLAAQWAQDVTGMVIHRFDTKVGIDGWAAPNGARAMQKDNGVEWRRVGAVWSQVTPWSLNASGTAQSGATNPATVSTLNIVSDPGPRFANISCFLLIDVFSGNTVTIELRFDGVAQARATIPKTGQLAVPGLNMQWPIALQAQGLFVPGNHVTPVSVVVGADATAAGIWHTTANFFENRLDCTVYPRGT